MRYKNLVLTNIIVLATALMCWETANAGENTFMRFGIWLKKEQIREEEEHLGQNFTAISALILSMDEKRVILYQKEPSYRVYLSIFEYGKEQVLWQTADIETLNYHWTPVPVLAEGLLDVNENPDLFICYSIACGNSQRSKCWNQNMLLFFDGRKGLETPILLSDIEKSFTKDGDVVYYTDQEGAQAFDRDSLVMILPASELIPLELHIWSRIERYEHPPTHAPGSVIYQVISYHFDKQQIAATATLEGTYHDTSEFLRTVLQERREHEKAPAPLLLNFLKKPTEYLCEEEEWFRYLEG